MKRVTIGMLAFTVFTSLTCLAQGQDLEPKRGIFWYKTPPAPQKTEKKKSEPVTPPPEPKPPVVKKADEYPTTMPKIPPYKELLTMHPKKLKKLYDTVEDLEVMDPTIDKAKAVLTLRRAMMAKSTADNAVEQLALLKYPELNPGAAYGITSPSRKIHTQINRQSISNILARYEKGFGLILLTSHDCYYCQAQADVLQMLHKRYGWTTAYLDIDSNPHAKASFHATKTPMTILVDKESNDWLTVSVGPVSLLDVVTNITQGIRLLTGQITPKQWTTKAPETGTYLDPTSDITEVGENPND